MNIINGQKTHSSMNGFSSSRAEETCFESEKRGLKTIFEISMEGILSCKMQELSKTFDLQYNLIE